MFSARFRLNRSPADTIQCETHELLLGEIGSGIKFALKNVTPDQPLKDGVQWAFVADGYASEEMANSEGQKIQLVLKVVLARLRIGADFGDRSPNQTITDEGLRALEAANGFRILRNVHGLMSYPTAPMPRFASSTLAMVRRVQVDRFRSTLALALNAPATLASHDVLSLALFNASFFQPTADGRFLLLVMAIEAMLQLAPRSPESRDHVEELIKLTRASTLDKSEKNSIVGSLNWLRSESISQGGRRIATQRLGSRRYMDKSPAEFFTYCYSLRSNLVHGNDPYPTMDTIATTVAPLELFASDLLTIPIIGFPD